MSRTILDQDLNTWEVYATPGDFGFAERARVTFRCVSDAGRRARAFGIDGDKAEAEAFVVERSDEELGEWLEEAQPVR